MCRHLELGIEGTENWVNFIPICRATVASETLCDICVQVQMPGFTSGVVWTSSLVFEDCDLLIAHEDVGFFLIEIKAVSLEAIESYGWKKCKINGRSEDAGPVSQAAGAMHSLKDYLIGRDVKLPLTPTAAWPLISRQRWNARWDDRRVCDEYAEKLFFAEDLYSTPSALIERLRYIRANPVYGDFRQGDPYSIRTQIETLTQELYVNAKPVQTPTDIERLKIIEDRVDKEERSRVPPRSGRHWYYHGKPGTGRPSVC